MAPPQQIQAPEAPVAPAIAQTGTAVAPPAARPMTSADVSALKSRRSELSRQLNSAAGRREELAKELVGKTGADRAGIEARLKLLDERLLQIETDIAANGKALASAPGALLAGSDAPPNISFGGAPMRPDVTAIAIVFTIFVLTPIALAAARLLWKRGNLPKVDRTIDREQSERLQRLESSVDTIALEIERISEGQRFVTKLLAETRQPVRIERGAEGVDAAR